MSQQQGKLSAAAKVLLAYGRAHPAVRTIVRKTIGRGKLRVLSEAEWEVFRPFEELKEPLWRERVHRAFNRAQHSPGGVSQLPYWHSGGVKPPGGPYRNTA